MSLACSGPNAATPPVSSSGGAGGSDGPHGGAGGAAGSGGVGGGSAGGGGTAGGAGAPCPADVTCVESFPFTDERDTSAEGKSSFDAYACAPDADESGPEIVYRVSVPADGFLSAAVYEQQGVDVDVHILGSHDPDDCLDRGNYHARADVGAGERWVVVDTFAQAGKAQAGAFRVDIGFTEPSDGPCTMAQGEMARVGDGGNHLKMPATGPVVKEAHLVTQEEPAPYPDGPTDELASHYALSQGKTGFVLHRDEPWAPLEGGSFYGCGIGSPADFPVLHEAWYVNMYWTKESRPAKGTRMILRDPKGGSRAVVVAAGYETGPGDPANIGGTVEEAHFYLGTGHESTLKLGIAVDQSLPFGPRRCTD